MIPIRAFAAGLAATMVIACSAQSTAQAAHEAAAPTSANHRIVRDGVGPVRVGMSRAQAEKALGIKFAIDDSQQPGGSCKYGRRADGKDRGVSYMLVNGRIERIDLFETPAFRTANGVGIGSSLKELQAAYPKQLLRVEKNDQDMYKLADRTGGIVFGIDKGAVFWINVGRYPALNFPEGCL